jgi:hypothetical protein
MPGPLYSFHFGKLEERVSRASGVSVPPIHLLRVYCVESCLTSSMKVDFLAIARVEHRRHQRRIYKSLSLHSRHFLDLIGLESSTP